ncbi:diaminopimelate dehydrogenase [Castellaniella sp. GW247-6E4]|uniref:diaminopimelate dehydrogenase n=1 Tax=Castellaniella sp. GW247-6E4 TaxID=3140380 RepID=UPI0033162D0B
MSGKIRVGIVGYGNLGRGAEQALALTQDMRLEAVFTRRDPASVVCGDVGVPVVALDQAGHWRDRIDVMLLCGGSRQDLPEQGPQLASMFTTVDSFDTHAHIPEYFAAMDQAARAAGTVAMISIGWDPGLFSINRLIGESVLPQGSTYTFWGKGLSQGHSDALRRVPGVRAAVQYTIPSPEAMRRVRAGERPTLATREKHTRECHVVLAEGADAQAVRQAIVTMPDYFADYDTTVHFITAEALARDHAAMPHGGFVIRSAETGDGTRQLIEFSLRLDSNPAFTSSVLVAYARAAHRMRQQGASGARTAFDVAPGLLSPRDPAQLRQDLL